MMDFGYNFGVETGPWFIALSVVIMLWVLAWQGFALWYSARNKQKIWFVAMLVISSLGILPIIYLLFFRKKGEARATVARKAKKK